MFHDWDAERLAHGAQVYSTPIVFRYAMVRVLSALGVMPAWDLVTALTQGNAREAGDRSTGAAGSEWCASQDTSLSLSGDNRLLCMDR